MTRPLTLGWALAVALLGAGCERVTRDMAEQPRVDPDQPSAFFGDGAAARPLPAGTVTSAGSAPAFGDSTRGTQATSARGRERYAIYCLPCHGPAGAGDGEVVRRGFPAPPPLQAQAARDPAWVETIRHGRGRMVGFADRVSDADARAIVAYLHTLPGASS